MIDCRGLASYAGIQTECASLSVVKCLRSIESAFDNT